MSEFIRLDMGPMSHIPAGNPSGALYLGNIPNAIQLGRTLNKRFWAILNCTDDWELDHLNAEQGFWVKRLDHWDGEEYPEEKIQDGITFIESNMAAGAAVLVCCHAGMSRSPGMVLAYLMSKKYDYNEAVRIIRKARPFIQIHPKIDLSVRKYFRLAPRSAADLIPGKNIVGY